MEALENWLDRVYDAGGDRNLLDKLYDEWAHDYDQQIWASGNPYISICASLFARHVPSNEAIILDAGCGTGNMAQVLYQTGYKFIDGLDPSFGMLEIARKKEVYRDLYPLFLASTIDIADESYDAIVAAGVLTHGHAPPESLDGLLRVMKPKAVMVFSLSEIAYREFEFGDKMDDLEKTGQWQKVDQSRLFKTYPFSEKEASLRHWVFTYQKA
ncbi:MAG: SAM-dependent methyltransferase [Gammaproteobacteria bacterium]|jgi:SAM-dependent methyltransferase